MIKEYLSGVCICALVLSASAMAHAQVNDVVTIKLLGVNDFHGQITQGRMVNGRRVGSAPVLAAYLRNAQQGLEKNTIITMMGDQVGASVAASGLLKHEPSILFLNTLGNQFCSTSYRMSPNCNLVATVGNHEFDQGLQELKRLIHGSKEKPTNNWIDLPNYSGATFPYISANIVDSKTGKPIFEPYVIKNVNGVKVAFIGAIIETAASSILPKNTKGIKFLNISDSINSYISEVKAKGADFVVAIMHEGGDSSLYEGDTQRDVKVSGSIKAVVNKLDDAVEVVMAGHTHRFLNAYLYNQHHHRVLVTQANSYSSAFADVTIKYDKATHAVLNKSARIVTTFADQYPGTAPDAQAAYVVKLAKASVAPVVSAHVGVSAHDVSHLGNDYGESSLGDLIADAFRVGLQADIGVTNASSIRASLKGGEVTWGQLYAIQPFANPVIEMQFKGKDILDLLEQQWKTAYKNILQVSGLSYHYNENNPIDYRVMDVMVNGKPINPEKLYTVAVTSFLASGGSGFSVMKRGKIITHGQTDLEVLVGYMKTLPEPFDMNIQGRVIGELAA